MTKQEQNLLGLGVNYLPANPASDDTNERSVDEPKSYFDPKSDFAYLEKFHVITQGMSKPTSPEILAHSRKGHLIAQLQPIAALGQPHGIPALVAYQVGDYDIVAAFDPQGAIAILCEQTDQDTSEYQLSDVEPVSDKHLDATEVFDQDEGKAELLKASLRQDIAKLTVPTYMYGWE